MSGIVLTLPLVAGKVEAWRRFCQEMAGSRRPMYQASRLRLGITRERMALVETAFGSAAVTTLEARDVGQALGQIITSALPFDCWYREQVQELHGVHLAGYEQFAQQALPALNQELLFEWTCDSDLDEGVTQGREMVGKPAYYAARAPIKTGQLIETIAEDHTNEPK